MPTKIEWCAETWNSITGCTPVSEGCAHCYAKRMATRLRGRYGYPADDPFRVTFHPDRLDQPRHWKKSRMIFVCSMGDLFHEDVKFDWFERIMDTICDPSWAWNHKFLMLTKRPKRMAEFFDRLGWWGKDQAVFPHIWLGVTAENQQRFDERWPVVSQIPAAVHFVSGEPLLSGIDFSRHEIKPDWFIVGGETGPGARPMHPDWARSLRDQCQGAGVPFFFKSWGDWAGFYAFGTSKGIVKDNGGTLEYAKDEYPWGDNGNEPVTWRVGKKIAGRLLDGREWNEYPEVPK